MKKYVKDLLKHQLSSEEAQLKELKKIYQRAIRDCDEAIRQLSARKDMENLQAIIYQQQYQKALKKQLEGIVDQLGSRQFTSISQYLNECYVNGYVGNAYALMQQGIPLILPIDQEKVVRAVKTESKISKGLYTALGEDVDQLKKDIRTQLSRGIAAGRNWHQIADELAGDFRNTPFNKAYNRSMTIVRTEGHRINEAANFDGMRDAKNAGADVVKQWVSVLDSVTRPNHRTLDGQIRELEDPYEVDNLQAMYPGGFGVAKEDCNCRCNSTQRAKWALGEDELAELRSRADYWGLDKSQEFDEFKEKYLKLPDNADTMELKNRPSENAVEQIIGGLNCWVEEVRSQDFPDGSAGGVKKNVPAVIYTTPDGTRFIYQKKYDKSKQSLTPEQAIEVWSKIPDNIRSKIQKEVYVVDYYNPQDSYWRKRYKNFDHSYATGGEDITLYRSSYHDMDYLLHTYCHEGGHYIDYTTEGADKTKRYCQQQKWKDAMSKDFETSGKKSYREYGENSELEDFADSVGYYVTKHDEFANLFPERTKLLDKILK